MKKGGTALLIIVYILNCMRDSYDINDFFCGKQSAVL